MAELPPQWSGPSAPPPPYSPRPRVDFEVIGLAWKVLTADPWTWAGASLLMFAVTFLAMLPVFLVFYFTAFQTLVSLQPVPGQPPNPEFFFRVFGLEAVFIVAIVFIQPIQFMLMGGMMDMTLRRMDGQPIASTDIFVGFRRFGAMYVAGLLYTLALYVGMVFCYVPGLLAVGVFSFVPILVMRGQARGIEALKMSWRILVSDIWMITLLMFCAQILSILGEFACIVGIFFTLPLAPIVTALTYRNFFPPTLQPTEGPRA
jgi:uncharacterized membrane protein